MLNAAPPHFYPHERRKSHPLRTPMHDGHWHKRREILEKLANELEQIRLCDCGVQSWDLLQSISNLLAKAEQKQWLSQQEQQRVMDWLAAAICQ
ncbi:MAG: hypothetical protein U1F55_08770 [Chitinivorax sp.]